MKGQLVSLANWDDQVTRYAYDQVGRRVAAEQPNGLLHQSQYDPAGRLVCLRHRKDNRLLGQFEYQVDKRGNRTQVYEALPLATTGATAFAYADPALEPYRGAWTDSAPFKTSANFGAGLRLAFCGMGEATLRMGVGPDHSIYDVYVDGALWQSFNGYAASEGDVALTLPLTDEGPHLLDLRNRPDKDKRSMGYVLRFHSLTTPATARQFDLQTTQYTYDTLARLIAADSYPATNTGAAATRHYAYAYDLAGNRTQANDNGTLTNVTYNAANQMTSGGAQYDAAGRLTSDGINTYAWDRANRLLSMGGTAYQYNGNGQRVQQTVGSLVTAYLNDLQPGLWQVLQATTGTDTTRYIHGPNGLQGQQNPDNAWRYPVQDGLGSVCGVVDADLNVLESLHYTPYGEQWGQTGTPQTDFGFTGEQTDGTRLVYLRARYYNPAMGMFTALDPLETSNRYRYVSGNPVNLTDHTGLGGPEECPLANPACTGFLQGAGVSLAAVWTAISSPAAFLAVGVTGAVAAGGAMIIIFFQMQPTPLTADEISKRIAATVNNIPDVNVEEKLQATARAYAMYGVELTAQPSIGAPATSTAPAIQTYPDTKVPPDVDISRDTTPEWKRQPTPATATATEWFPAPTCTITKTPEGECRVPGSSRTWDRTVFVPSGWEPADLIRSQDLGLPPFHAGQTSASKKQVECVASAIKQGIWVEVGGSIAPISFGQWNGRARPGINVGDWVMADGHHRFLGSLLSGISLKTFSPNYASLRGFPLNAVRWDDFTWGKND